MKWSHPGHELDAIGECVKRIRRIWIFGAGVNGGMLHGLLSPHLDISGFLDNKAGSHASLFGKPVAQPEECRADGDDAAIVVALSPAAVPEAMRQMRALGFTENRNLFSMQLFAPVFSLFRLNQVCLPSVSFLPTTRCNLRCRHCLNFSPRIARHEQRTLADLTADVDVLFSRVDRVMLFHLSGGEPLLYPDFAGFLAHLGGTHRTRMERLEFTTNGTMPPSDEVCRVCRDYDVHVFVDDYRDSVPEQAGKFDEVVARLEKWAVPYRVSRVDAWIDLLPDEVVSERGGDELRRHFEVCAVPWQEYRQGKLYACNYSGYADVAGIYPIADDDVFDIAGMEPARKAELVEFRLGYTNKGYVEFCRRCAGYGNNSHAVGAAEQLPRESAGNPV